MTQVLSKDLLIDNLMTLALKRKTVYNNGFPYNCGYCHAGDIISADCWNLFKAIVWSHGTLKDNHTSGKYFYVDKESGLGDWVGEAIMNNCTDVSTNFTKLEAGEVLLYSDKSHWGHYVGEFTDSTGVCNCVESTMSFDQRITTSYVDSQGRRFDHKGGIQYGRWGWHGKPTKWVSGFDKPQPQPTPTADITTLAIEVYQGKWGNDPERKQKLIAKYGEDVRNKVQAKVDKMCKVLADAKADAKKVYDNENLCIQIADEILLGKWGNNPERKEKIVAKYGEEVRKKAQGIVDKALV